MVFGLRHSKGDGAINGFILDGDIQNTVAGVCVSLRRDAMRSVHLRLAPDDAMMLGRLLQEYGKAWTEKSFPGRSFP